MTKLSDNFSLHEFTRTSHANIANVPSDSEIENLKALCIKVLQPLRHHFKLPVEIESGFRCPELNKAVGGAATSQHLKGEAADMSIKGVRNDDIWTFIRDNLPFDQLIAERLRRDDGSAGWIHVSYSRTHERRDAISSPKPRVYVPGLVYAA